MVMARKPKTTEAASVLHGYKAYDKDLKCRGYQYEIGKTYETDQHPVRCGSTGFHWCENPLDMWSYYDITTSRFTVVEASGEHDKGSDDTKIASARLTIGVELRLPEVIDRGIKWLLEFCKDKTERGHYSQLAASGHYSQLAASGYYSQLAASGYSSQLAAAGHYSKLAASGHYSKLAASGHYSKLAVSGYSSQLAASGDSSQLAASGHSSQLAAAGHSSQLAASGDSSQLAASGYYSRLNLGENSAGVLAWHDGKRPRFTVLYTGENGIKAGVWYCLNSKGEPEECK
jgi:hypothetical protein